MKLTETEKIMMDLYNLKHSAWRMCEDAEKEGDKKNYWYWMGVAAAYDHSIESLEKITKRSALRISIDQMREEANEELQQERD